MAALIAELVLFPFALLTSQPLFTAPLLFTLSYYPQGIQQILPEKLLGLTSSSTLLNVLWGLFIYSVLREVNQYASRAVLNNFNSDTWRTEEEIVLVTGGSSGIGEMMVHQLAAKAAKVIVFDLAPSKKELPPNAFFFQVNVNDSKRISEVAVDIRSKHGDPTVLINNAGILSGLTILDEPEDLIRRTFDVNIVAHFLLVKEFLPAMIEKNHGHIVTLASMASFIVCAQTVDYACTKAAAVAFHEGVAAELKSRYGAQNVKTTIVNPTWIRTPLVAKMAKDGKFNTFTLAPETVVDAIVKHLLAGQSGQLILPPRASLLTGIRGWPSWLQEYVRNSQASTLTVVGGLR